MMSTAGDDVTYPQDVGSMCRSTDTAGSIDIDVSWTGTLEDTATNGEAANGKVVERVHDRDDNLI